MKIFKILGVVVGIHAFAFLLFFVNPGCSSANKTAAAEPAPSASAPAAAVAADPAPATAPATPLVPAGDASAPAPTSAPAAGPVFYSPTRPNTPEAAALETPQAAADVTPVATYVVKSGDSLWTIAHRNHIKVSELASANHLRSGSPLHAGQKLIIPGKPGPATSSQSAASSAKNAPAPSASAADAGTPQTKTTASKYTVRPGDKLSSIARRYGLTTGDLAEANNITDPARIRPGQELIIPAGHTRSGGRKSRSSSSHKQAQPAETAPASVPTAPAPSDSTAPAPTAPAPEASPSSAAPSAASVPIIRIQGANDASAPSSSGSAPSQ